MKSDLPFYEDPEGSRVPNGCDGVIDAHVQCFDMGAPYMEPIYQMCSDEQKPLIMHVGREPKSEEYKCDPYDICSVQLLESVIKNFPDWMRVNDKNKSDKAEKQQARYQQYLLFLCEEIRK